jgi:hypothetical protein
MCDEDIVVRFIDYFKLGSITTNLPKNTKHSRSWKWTVCGDKAIVATCSISWYKKTGEIYRMLPVLQAVAPLAKILFNTIDKSVPDKDLAAKLKNDLQTQMLQSHTQELTAAAKIIEAEAKAGWFASSWRPLLMYVLIFILIWNYVLGPVILFFFKASITITLPGDNINSPNIDNL